MKQQKRQALEGALCCLPAAAGVGALYLAPFALALARSLSRGMGGGFAGLENYRELEAAGFGDLGTQALMKHYEK